jgi:hypothetical protein
MPVVQKTGPDGCLYVLDWYDRYHCYQDANRDPAGIDRLKGRLYRIRHTATPRGAVANLGSENETQLVQRLKSPNVYQRDIAQRLLNERMNPTIRASLEAFVLDDANPRKARMHGLWSLIGAGPLPEPFHLQLLNQADSGVRAWAVRAAGNARKVDDKIRQRIGQLAKDPSRDVQLQVVIAATKLQDLNPLPVLLDVLAAGGDDSLIPQIVWQNLHPLLENRSDEFMQLVKQTDLKQNPNLAKLIPRVTERILAKKKAG